MLSFVVPDACSRRNRETTMVPGKRLHDVVGAYYPHQDHQQYLPGNA
jgi:hypothetical protein